MPTRRQHSKGKKRPGHWHQGPSLAREQVPRLRALARAERRGAAVELELDEERARGREETALWEALAHVSPAALELWPSWL